MMKLSKLKPVLVLAIAAAFTLFGCGAPGIMATSVSDPTVQLSSDTIRGKVTVIDFWATWCGPCRMTMPNIQTLYDYYSPKGVQFAGITTDSPATVKKFLAANDYTYPMYSDDDRVTSSGFDVESIPYLVVIDKHGRVAYTEDGAPLDLLKVRKAIDDALGG